MKEVATLLNEMRAERVITEHALFGAVAQMRYTEPVATRDADVLVVLPSAQGLGVLASIHEFCSRKAYAPGRAKALTRILALLEAASVTPAEIALLAQRHGLSDAWTRFKTRFLDD